MEKRRCVFLTRSSWASRFSNTIRPITKTISDRGLPFFKTFTSHKTTLIGRNVSRFKETENSRCCLRVNDFSIVSSYVQLISHLHNIFSTCQSKSFFLFDLWLSQEEANQSDHVDSANDILMAVSFDGRWRFNEAQTVATSVRIRFNLRNIFINDSNSL